MSTPHFQYIFIGETSTSTLMIMLCRTSHRLELHSSKCQERNIWDTYADYNKTQRSCTTSVPQPCYNVSTRCTEPCDFLRCVCVFVCTFVQKNRCMSASKQTFLLRYHRPDETRAHGHQQQYIRIQFNTTIRCMNSIQFYCLTRKKFVYLFSAGP